MKVGIVGQSQRGKSTLINCLLKKKVAKTGGMGVSETDKNSIYHFNNDIDLVDTPGYNANNKDTKAVKEVLSNLDFAIVVLKNKGLSESDKAMMDFLENKGIRYTIIINCLNDEGVGLWHPSANNNKQVAYSIESTIKEYHCALSLNGLKVNLVNLLWYWYAIGNYKNDADADIVDKAINYYMDSQRRSQVDFEKESNVGVIIDFIFDKYLINSINQYNHYNRRLIDGLGKINTIILSYKKSF